MKRASYQLKSNINDLADGVSNSKVKLPEKGGRILVYHSIASGKYERINTKSLELKMLKEQLTWLKANANVVPGHEVDFQNQGRFQIAITFDDGFANNLALLEIVEELEIPVTIFVTAIELMGQNFLWPDALDLLTKRGSNSIELLGVPFSKSRGDYRDANGVSLKSHCISSGYGYAMDALAKLGFRDAVLSEYPEEYWRMLSKPEIKLLADSKYITIASHGVKHNDLALLSKEELCNELTDSKNFLEEITGKEVNQIAFPYGRSNQLVIESAKDIGYKWVFSEGDNQQEGAISRLTINPFTSWNNQLRAIAKGKY